MYAKVRLQAFSAPPALSGWRRLCSPAPGPSRSSGSVAPPSPLCLMLPKGDTVKQIAEKLHISPAARISALPSDDLTLHYCLECISRYTCTQASERPPTMPLICSILLQKPLKTFFFMERHTTPPLGPSTHFRYILHEARSPTPPYGILVEELRDGVWAAFAVFAPFSSDRLADLNVIFSTNQLQLSTPI